MKKSRSASSTKKQAKPVSRNILISKTEIAAIFEDMANLLEITGANPFKTRAFTNAARELESLPGDLVDMVNSGELLDVQGIGKGIFAHIREILETGTFDEFEALRAEVPAGLLTMLRIPGVGPKKVKTLHDTIGVKSVDELEQAASEGRIAPIPGFGEKSQEKIISGIERMRRYRKRHLLSAAVEAGDAIYADVSRHPDVKRALLGGSLRRRRETIKDIDILVSATKSEAVMELLATHPSVQSVTAKGSTKTSVVLHSGINVDLRVVKDHEFPFAAMYFTGSKEHNTDMRGRAKKMGYKLNEYGLFKNDKATRCQDEAAVFRKLGLDYIEPELRESMGELEAAENQQLPDLVTMDDIKGLLHVHTTYSDGTASIEELVRRTASMGLSYLGIADHSRSCAAGHGLDEAAVRKQAAEVAAVRELLPDMTLLHGIESDILPDGSLDYADDLLAAFDFVVASVHDEVSTSEKTMTDRLIRAISNPFTTILGHPTGRLLLEREGYKVDLMSVIDACADNEVMIEINANPRRLDLDWRFVRRARDKGVALVICPDAHSCEELANYRYGVSIARKGWLGARDVFNTRSAADVKRVLQSRRSRRG